MSKLLTALLGMTLGGSLMGLLLLALRPILRHRGCHTALYYLYLPVLLRFLLPLPGLLSPFSMTSAEAVPAAVYAAAASDAPLLPSDGTNPTQTASNTAETPTAAIPFPAEAEELPEALPVPAPAQSARQHFTLTALLSTLYIAGFALSLLGNLLAYARFSRAVRRSGQRADERAYALLEELAPGENIGLLRSPAVPVPLLMGLRRPLIVLPDRDIDKNDLPDVLRHELNHRRRRDLGYKWLMLLALCVHWFDPLLYVLRRSMADDCELSCDEGLLRTMTPNEKQHYGEMLIRLSAAPALPAALPAATLSEGRAALEKRLRSIMDSARPRRGTAVIYALCALLLCGCGAVIGGEGREKAESEPTPIFYRDGKGLWSTDGDLWYAAGTLVYSSENLWSTDGDPWYGNAGWWTTDGNVFYSGNGWTTDGNTVYDLSYYTYPRLPAFATDGNVNSAYCDAVTVSTVEELLAALTSNVCITLQPGIYDLSRAAVDFYPAVYWRPEGGGQQMLCTNLYSVSLRGATGDPGDVTILLSEEAPAGLLLDGCVGLNFQGLTFAAESGAGAACDLLQIRNSYNVYFGCCAFSSVGGAAVGTEGSNFVTLSDCRFARTGKSCTECRDSSNLLLENCEFNGSRPSFVGCSDVCINDSTLDGAQVLYSFPKLER